MEEDNGRSFNCAESVIIGVNRNEELPGFNSACMRIGSILGGGISGYGEVCGAVSGGVVSLGLILGTDGDEPPEEFKTKREKTRDIVKQYLEEFTKCWGTVRCEYLIEMDEGKRDPLGNLRPDGPPRKLCDDYVEWSVKKIHDIRNSLT